MSQQQKKKGFCSRETAPRHRTGWQDGMAQWGVPRDAARCQEYCRQGPVPGSAPSPPQHFAQVSPSFSCSSLHVALASSSLRQGGTSPSPSELLSPEVDWRNEGVTHFEGPQLKSTAEKAPKDCSSCMEEVSFYSTVEEGVIVPTHAVSCKSQHG